MLCSDTDKTAVFHLPYLSVDEARDINEAKGVIMSHAEEGDILLKIKHGCIPIIETMIRNLRRHRSTKAADDR